MGIFRRNGLQEFLYVTQMKCILNFLVMHIAILDLDANLEECLGYIGTDGCWPSPE